MCVAHELVASWRALSLHCDVCGGGVVATESTERDETPFVEVRWL